MALTGAYDTRACHATRERVTLLLSAIKIKGAIKGAIALIPPREGVAFWERALIPPREGVAFWERGHPLVTLEI
ncbi:hypothetical protein AB6D20_028015 (plasmid) [Vibrio splendidus]